MQRDGLKSITDAELNEVLALVGRGRAIPAVIVAAIIRRLEAAEYPDRSDLHGILAA
jgi:hypothetical protein